MLLNKFIPQKSTFLLFEIDLIYILHNSDGMQKSLLDIQSTHLEVVIYLILFLKHQQKKLNEFICCFIYQIQLKQILPKPLEEKPQIQVVN